MALLSPFTYSNFSVVVLGPNSIKLKQNRRQTLKDDSGTMVGKLSLSRRMPNRASKDPPRPSGTKGYIV